MEDPFQLPWELAQLLNFDESTVFKNLQSIGAILFQGNLMLIWNSRLCMIHNENKSQNSWIQNSIFSHINQTDIKKEDNKIVR